MNEKNILMSTNSFKGPRRLPATTPWHMLWPAVSPGEDSLADAMAHEDSRRRSLGRCYGPRRLPAKPLGQMLRPTHLQ